MIIAGCGKGSVESNTVEQSGLMPERVVQGPQMPSKPPIPLDQVEARIAKLCPVKLNEWRRTYSYRWRPELKNYSTEDLSFVFQKGPYPDFRPSRSWRDVREVAAIDDRPGVEVIFGHYQVNSGKVAFEVGCDQKTPN
jgi:hypothetical protein